MQQTFGELARRRRNVTQAVAASPRDASGRACSRGRRRAQRIYTTLFSIIIYHSHRWRARYLLTAKSITARSSIKQPQTRCCNAVARICRLPASLEYFLPLNWLRHVALITHSITWRQARKTYGSRVCGNSSLTLAHVAGTALRQADAPYQLNVRSLQKKASKPAPPYHLPYLMMHTAIPFSTFLFSSKQRIFCILFIPVLRPISYPLALLTLCLFPSPIAVFCLSAWTPRLT